MSVSIRRLILMILGVIAGAAAWPLIELLLTFQRVFPSYFSFSLAQGIIFGAVLGAFYGSGEGLTSKEKGKILNGALTGVITGIAGGVIGFLAGQAVLFLVIQYTFSSFRTHQYIVIPLARILGWVILGVAIGASEGVRARSLKKCLVGAAGGGIGGILGGAAIEYLRTIYPDLIYARLVGFVLFGLFIGLFYSLLERRVSLGVVRVLNGGKRGKEYSFAQNRLTIGSTPKNDIVLEGYAGVAPKHASFRIRGKDVYIEKEGEQGRVLVNEAPIRKSHLLKYEDVIQVGSAKIFYKTE